MLSLRAILPIPVEFACNDPGNRLDIVETQNFGSNVTSQADFRELW
jgi:hypothetical protein